MEVDVVKPNNDISVIHSADGKTILIKLEDRCVRKYIFNLDYEEAKDLQRQLFKHILLANEAQILCSLNEGDA